jgi:hypothetical protein
LDLAELEEVTPGMMAELLGEAGGLGEEVEGNFSNPGPKIPALFAQYEKVAGASR